MKFISFIFLFTLLGLNGLCQLTYSELEDLNILCKKEDFEAVKTFLKNKEYVIYNDQENYDHGSYFVLSEIQAKKKLGEYNNEFLKGTDLDNIDDEIQISFYDYDDYKKLEIDQSHYYKDSFNYSLDQRKFDPLFQWLYEDWDYVEGKDYNTYVDSVWKKDANGKINSESYNKYFLHQEIVEKPSFGAIFRKDDSKSEEKKDYELFYDYRIIESNRFSMPRISTAIHLKTLIEKGGNIDDDRVKILTFPLIKNGSSYLIKLKFGNLLKTYVMDSGASDMTIDDETYKYLKSKSQLKIEDSLTSRNYILANGSIVRYARIKIPVFSIKNIEINNISAILVENGQPLLLGKSFLDSFKSWKVDNKDNVLILEEF